MLTRAKKICPFPTAAALALTVVLVACGCGGDTADTPTAPTHEENFSWELSGARVINAGQTTQTAQGLLTTGYEVEASARAGEGSGLISDGRFTAKMTAFTPAVDLSGQVAGHTYINGSWTIVDVNASPEEIQARHSSAKAGGTLEAEVTFNPLTQPGDFAATIRLPMSPAAGRWAQGQGTFNGNGAFEGSIYGLAAVWPEGPNG